MFTALWAWICNNPVVQKIALWAAAILAVLLGYKMWKNSVEQGVRRQEREARERDQLKEQVKVSETRREIEQQRTTDAQRANEATDALPRFGSADELRDKRPDLGSIVFGDDQGGSR